MSLPVPSTSSIGYPDPKQFQEFEQPLIELAQRSGGDLRKLLTAFFGFLHRRTDFYVITDSEQMGFKEGDAEKLLLAAFRQFPLRRLSNKKGTPPPQAAPAAKKPPPSSPEPPKSAPTKLTAETAATELAKKSKDSEKEPTAIVRRTKEGLQIPVGNGGTTKSYRWTQTLEECTVLIGVPTGTRGKDLDVSIRSNALSVRSKQPLGDDDEIPRTFVNGDLTHPVIVDESTWSLESNVLTILLFKKMPTFWETILVGDDQIDTSLVDSTRHISTYDEGTQAQIRKIMFDQQQLDKGLPTSDELTNSGTPKIPPLPEGVEFIDQETLDQHAKKPPG